MMLTRLTILFLIIAFTLGVANHGLCANAEEILEQAAKTNLHDNFRITLTIKTTKAGKSAPDNVIWLVGKPKDKAADVFMEFDEPKESKGLRFLFQMEFGKDPKAYMYLPSTGKTMPLDVDDPSADVGGTGMTMEDIQGFFPRAGEKATLLKEEKADGADCYLIQILLPENRGERLVWVSKKDLLVVKAVSKDPQGKVKRIFQVTQLFKTDEGKEFPREEEISIPDKKVKIHVRQDSAVFGMEIPEELLNPETFATYKWRP
jgi:hypothetical protein